MVEWERVETGRNPRWQYGHGHKMRVVTDAMIRDRGRAAIARLVYQLSLPPLPAAAWNVPPLCPSCGSGRVSSCRDCGQHACDGCGLLWHQPAGDEPPGPPPAAGVNPPLTGGRA